MTGIDVESGGPPPITHEDVLKAIADGNYRKAVGVLMAMVANRALREFATHSIHFHKGPGFDELSTPQMVTLAFQAARHEAKKREGTAEHDRLDAAAMALGAVAALQVRLNEGKWDDDPSETLAELIFVSVLLGQAEVVMAGHIEGYWKEIEKARQNRESRRENQKRQAEALAAWVEPTIKLCIEHCRRNPRVSDVKLADAVWSDKAIPKPSYERVLKVIRTNRKASGPIPRRAKI